MKLFIDLLTFAVCLVLSGILASVLGKITVVLGLPIIISMIVLNLTFVVSIILTYIFASRTLPTSKPSLSAIDSRLTEISESLKASGHRLTLLDKNIKLYQERIDRYNQVFNDIALAPNTPPWIKQLLDKEVGVQVEMLKKHIADLNQYNKDNNII